MSSSSAWGGGGGNSGNSGTRGTKRKNTTSLEHGGDGQPSQSKKSKGELSTPALGNNA